MQVFSQRTDKPRATPFLTPSQDPSKYLPFDPIEWSISSDGKTWNSDFDQPDLVGAYCYLHSPVPITETNNFEKLGINDGQRLNSTSYELRTFTMNIWFVGMSEADMYLAYDALQRFMVSRDPFWICFSDWPQRMYYVKAAVAQPTYLSDKGWTAVITLTDLYGMSRSVGTTLDHIMGFGNNERMGQLPYIFQSNDFVVHNGSDVRIDPERRGHPLTITLDGNSSGNMKITNKTTGDSISRPENWSGTWVLDGVNPMLNKNNDGINTDHGIITLQKGDNSFHIDNFSGKVTFDFPLWWLS